MNTNKKKKELTPQQLQQRKKMMIYPLLFLIFAGAMWLIFAPSGSSEKQKDGLNIDLPNPNTTELVGDKKTAYEREAYNNKQNDNRRNLQDFAFMLGEVEQQKDQYERQEIASLPDDYEPNNSKGHASGIQSSVNAYQQVNSQLSNWYDQPAIEDDQEQLDLEWRLQEVERKLEEKELARNMAEEQLELMEKSLQMATKYMPGMTQPSTLAVQENSPVVQTAVKYDANNTKAQPVIRQVRHNAVSLLATPMAGDEFIEAYGKPRNMDFNTVAGMEEPTDKNTIKACVNQTRTLTNGQEIQLRLLDAMRVGNMIIPANTILTGTAKVVGEKMDIIISTIQYADNIVHVNLTVYDTNGQKGLSAPGSEEMNAVKEIAANAGGNLNSSINISQQSAGQQLLTDIGRGALQGTSQYIAKKMREIKITVKAGYIVLLLPQN